MTIDALGPATQGQEIREAIDYAEQKRPKESHGPEGLTEEAIGFVSSKLVT